MDNTVVKEYISNAELIKKIKSIAENINNDYFNVFAKDEKLVAICVLKGAFMFYSELVKYLKMPIETCFVTLSSYLGEMSSSGKVVPVDIKLPDLNNKNVLIVEDIIDTGTTLNFFSEYLKSNFDIKCLKIVTLLDKKEGRKINFSPDYSVFDIDNKFVVGFGMDYKELYRNLDYVGYIPF